MALSIELVMSTNKRHYSARLGILYLETGRDWSMSRACFRVSAACTRRHHCAHAHGCNASSWPHLLIARLGDGAERNAQPAHGL